MIKPSFKRRLLLSERRGSNSRHPPWQGGALPAELLSHEIGVQNYSFIIDLSIGFRQEFKLSFLAVQYDHTHNKKYDITNDGIQTQFITIGTHFKTTTGDIDAPKHCLGNC